MQAKMRINSMNSMLERLIDNPNIFYIFKFGLVRNSLRLISKKKEADLKKLLSKLEYHLKKGSCMNAYCYFECIRQHFTSKSDHSTINECASPFLPMLAAKEFENVTSGHGLSGDMKSGSIINFKYIWKICHQICRSVDFTNSSSTIFGWCEKEVFLTLLKSICHLPSLPPQE